MAAAKRNLYMNCMIAKWQPSFSQLHHGISQKRQTSFPGGGNCQTHVRLETELFRQTTDTGLLLHYQSHVDMRYKQSLLKMMLKRAFKLSSNWQLFHLECNRLTQTLSRLLYPAVLLQSTISIFVTAKVPGDLRSKQMRDEKKAPVRITFKDQRPTNSVRRQLGELSHKIGTDIQPVSSQKIESNTKPRERNPLLWINNALYTISSVICAMQIMSATHADTCINVLRNIRSLRLWNTSDGNMGGTQMT